MVSAYMGHFGVSVWKFSSFSSNGLDIGCSVKRLPGLTLGLTVPFWSVPVVSSSVVRLELFACFCWQVPVLWYWLSHVWVKASWVESVFSWAYVYPWNPVIINALRLYVGVLWFPKGSASELLGGSLKLRHCTTFFYHALSPIVFTWGW